MIFMSSTIYNSATHSSSYESTVKMQLEVDSDYRLGYLSTDSGFRWGRNASSSFCISNDGLRGRLGFHQGPGEEEWARRYILLMVSLQDKFRVSLCSLCTASELTETT